MKVINEYFRLKNEIDPIDVISLDWDNLIILDACRLDFFERRNRIDGHLHEVQSAGGDSWEFMRRSFLDRSLRDTIYVTANPHAVRIPDGVFFKIENTLDRWDSDIEVVHPKDVADAAISVYERYPHKRLIIHFMQPHIPWLGPTAEEIRAEFDVWGNNKNHGKEMMGYDVTNPVTGDTGWFELAKRGHISYQTMYDAYSETLDIALEHAQKVLREIPGKSVLTADHGEMLGERIGTKRWWGHYSNFWTEKLRYVPWLETKASRRRDIVEDTPKQQVRVDEEEVADKLRALGYK